MLSILNRYRLILLLVVELILASNVKWGQDRWKQIIAFDGKGYYSYLPAIFIYDDLQFGFHDSIEKNYSSNNTFYDYRQPAGNGVINKCFVGTSIAMFPFFSAGHAMTILTGGIRDGFSFYYQLMISIAAIVYGIIGLFFIIKILRLYGISENIISVVILSIALSTSLFNYTLFEQAMSHVYSFAFVTFFIYLLKKFCLNPDKKILFGLTAIYAIIILMRPINGIIILAFPFIAGSVENIKRGLNSFRNLSDEIPIAVIIFLSILIIQPTLYYIQSGNFFNYSYGEEKLIWGRPEILNILFSYRKGLFVYAPILFLSMFGLIPLYRQNRFAFFSFLFFFFSLCYVLSCWWNWWYGGSFGFRPFVEFYSLPAILFGLLLMSIKKRVYKIWISIIVISCFILNQVQTYQYRYFIIHWDKMDKEHYWRVFMRIDQLAKKDIEGNPNQDLIETK